MIQRIQTLYLAGVVAVSAVLFSIPMYRISATGDALNQVFTFRDNIFLTGLNSIVILLALVAVFLYKHRMLQIRICSLNILLVSILIVSVFYFSDKPVTADTTLNFEPGAYLVLVNLVLLWLSLRAIRKDDALVRSADRLR